MKYIIPQEKLEKIVFKYLDKMYSDLEQHKAYHYRGIVFKKPNDDSEYGIMGWTNSNILYMCYELIKEISSMFSIKESDSMEIIGKWVEDRYKLRIANFRGLMVVPINGLKIDSN